MEKPVPKNRSKDQNMYTSCVKPRQTPTEPREPTRTAEMRTLRDRIPNQEIRQICDIQRLTRQRRQEWNQHIDRMKDGKPHSRRPPGRPPKRWRDSWMSTSQGTP